MVRVLLEVLVCARGAGGWGKAFLLALLLLHPSVLEPDLHLGLVQLERGSYFHPSRSREVFAEMELLLKLRQLLGCEVGPDGALWAQAVICHFCCEKQTKC